MSTALRVAVRGVGLLGPGLPDWATGQALLREPSAWRPAPTPLVAPALLPPAERRRAGAIVKLTLAVAEQACAQAGVDTRELATVFTSSSGDAANCHALCEALAAAERMVSPTRFTNSVHNAAAGYWHIATASRAPSTSLAGRDASFAAGLLEAASQCAAWSRPVLLVAGDVPYPEPMHAARPLPDAFAVALLLVPDSPSPASARLTLRLTPMSDSAAALDAWGSGDAVPGDAPIDDAARVDTAQSDVARRDAGLGDARLDALRCAVPAARALPLLQALARGEGTTLQLDDLLHCALQVELDARLAPA